MLLRTVLLSFLTSVLSHENLSERGSPIRKHKVIAAYIVWYILDFLGEVLGDNPSFFLLLFMFAWMG